MRLSTLTAVAAAACLLAAPATAQDAAGAPGRPDASQVTAGVYKVDPHHTQVVWSVDHLGFSTLYGMVGQMSGTLALDPAQPSAAKLQIDIPLEGLTLTSDAFDKHLRGPDFFEVDEHPTARFVSTSVAPRGTGATITGDLTLHGVTRPVVLQATLKGAGLNPVTKVETVGFSATGKINRSDFGLGYGVPMVSDEVELAITAAFEKPGQ